MKNNAERLENLTATLIELVARSETCIKETHSTIDKLVEHQKWIEQQYVHHIDRLESKLSRCIEGKQELIGLTRQQMCDNEKMADRYEKLLDRYEQLARSSNHAAVNPVFNTYK